MNRLELEYALYQDDDFITCGTIKEISEETGISEKNLRYYSLTTNFHEKHYLINWDIHSHL